MNSMTGYGYKETVIDGTHISVEFKSVNSRFLDLNINIPPFLNSKESEIRSVISRRISRGKLDVFIRVRDENLESEVFINKSLAKSYVQQISSLLNELEKESSKFKELTIGTILAQDGVTSVIHKYDADGCWGKIEGVFNEVLNQYDADRKREGENLKTDLLEKLSVLDECAAFFKEWQPKMEEKFKNLISTKFHELLEDKVDENRIMTETAAMLVKYTINEEIIRLQSHLCELRKEILNNEIPGKKIDFICQEANREINTIGSKNQFIEVGQKVIIAKDALENIREQCKNVE